MARLGAAPDRTVAALGPRIAQQAYVVDAEFAGRFRDPADARFFTAAGSGKRRFDLGGCVVARLAARRPDLLLAGVSPGVAEFAAVAGAEVDGALAPVQWHPEAVANTSLGPSIPELLTDARTAGVSELDYVAVQAYAAALIAAGR